MDEETGMLAPDFRTASVQRREALATLKEICYAEALRLQIRESSLKRRGPPPFLWRAHAD